MEPSREGGSTFLKLSQCTHQRNRQLCARYTGRLRTFDSARDHLTRGSLDPACLAAMLGPSKGSQSAVNPIARSAHSDAWVYYAIACLWLYSFVNQTTSTARCTCRFRLYLRLSILTYESPLTFSRCTLATSSQVSGSFCCRSSR